MRIRQRNEYLSSPLEEQIDSGCEIQDFRERRHTFSLDFRPFGPSVLDGARSKDVLRGEGYALTLIWWTSNNSKR